MIRMSGQGRTVRKGYFCISGPCFGTCNALTWRTTGINTVSYFPVHLCTSYSWVLVNKSICRRFQMAAKVILVKKKKNSNSTIPSIL